MADDKEKGEQPSSKSIVEVTDKDVAEATKAAYTLIDASDRLDRLVLNGNAGGTIATLGFMGTIVGAGSGRSPIPTLTFAVLVIFLMGLGTAIWVQYRVTEHHKAAALTKLVGPPHEEKKSGSLSYYLRKFSLVALGSGTILGLYQLWQLTGSILPVSGAAS